MKRVQQQPSADDDWTDESELSGGATNDDEGSEDETVRAAPQAPSLLAGQCDDDEWTTELDDDNVSDDDSSGNVRSRRRTTRAVRAAPRTPSSLAGASTARCDDDEWTTEPDDSGDVRDDVRPSQTHPTGALSTPVQVLSASTALRGTAPSRPETARTVPNDQRPDETDKGEERGVSEPHDDESRGLTHHARPLAGPQKPTLPPKAPSLLQQRESCSTDPQTAAVEPPTVIARLEAALSLGAPLSDQELNTLLKLLRAQQNPQALIPTLNVVLRSPLAGSAAGGVMISDLSQALFDMTKATLAAAARTCTLPETECVWRCAQCAHSKSLRGRHLDGKTEVRSECGPCSRKTLFKRGRALTDAEIANLTDDESVWHCGQCSGLKDLRGGHLDGKIEVRSECQTCSRKTLFKRGCRNPVPAQTSENARLQNTVQTTLANLSAVDGRDAPSDVGISQFCTACTSEDYRSIFQVFGRMMRGTNATTKCLGVGPAVALLLSVEASVAECCRFIHRAATQRHVLYRDLHELRFFAPAIENTVAQFAPEVANTIGAALSECAAAAESIIVDHDDLRKVWVSMLSVPQLRPAATQAAPRTAAARKRLVDLTIAQWAPVTIPVDGYFADRWGWVRSSSIFSFLWTQTADRSRDSPTVWEAATRTPEEELTKWDAQMRVVETEWKMIAKALNDRTICVDQAAALFPADPKFIPELCTGLANSAEAQRAAQKTATNVEKVLSQLIELEHVTTRLFVSNDFPSATGTVVLALRAKSMQHEIIKLQIVAQKLGVQFPADHPFQVLTTALNNDATIGDVAAAFEVALQSEQGLINKLPMGFLAAFEAALDAGMPRLCREFPSHAVLCNVVQSRRSLCTQDQRRILDGFVEAHAALSQGSAVISSSFECWKERKFKSYSALIDYLTEINWVGGRLATIAPHLESIEEALRGDTHEDTLLHLLEDAHTMLHGPDGWTTPRADPAAEVQGRVQELADARTAFSALTASDMPSAPADIAEHRARCCTAAENLVACLPLLLTSEESSETAPCCVTGVDACSLRPPPELISALVAAVAAAKKTHADAVAGISRAVSHPCRPVAAAARATAIANEACGLEVEALQEVMKAANAALTGAAALTAEECGHHRSIAESLLETESPWAGDVGLQRRDAAITSLDVLTAHRKAAQQAVKRAERAITRAELDLHSDADDDEAIEAATTALQTAKAQLSAALPELHTATAAVQQWATSGEGALALQAFPGDGVLTSALSGLFEADFSVETALARTPAVDMAVEYAASLTESPDATCVYYAERSVAGNDGTATDVPVVLRRLRLSTAEHVAEAKRQLHDAGRIAVGLQACPDAAAGCPPVVKATRWFMAEGPGGGVADAWLEFPRARHGTLAEALLKSSGFFSAAAASGLCQRLVRAVAQLHAAGIRHGDLNPSNIVLWDDPGSTVVRPGIIDLLDTVSVGATRTLRGATMEWLPPEAVSAMTAGEKVLGTRQLDLWQLGRICQAVLSTSNSSAELVAPVREAVAALCVADPAARRSAGEVLFDIEAAIAGAADATATARRGGTPWALPPASWLCQRGAASGVDFVELDIATDPAAIALAACAVSAGRRVRAVCRLENVRLWHVYAAERAHVGEQAQGAPWPLQVQQESSQSFAAAPDGARQALVDDVDHDNEVLLFHGAAPNTHRLIAEGGLDPSYSGDRVGSLFGAATCLTPLWAKAANEYARGAGAGVFVTRVAVGRVADCLTTPSTVTSRYRRPADGHHSVVGRNGTPGVVVAVYRPSRMYPEYLVTFED